jgi:Na+/melibiose symporter-like transporter
VIRVSMFSHDAVFTLSNLAALLNYGATFAISYLVSIYLQVVMGYSSRTAGLILIFMPVVQAAFSPVMGKLSDKSCTLQAGQRRHGALRPGSGAFLVHVA